jgi:hypothetical protein
MATGDTYITIDHDNERITVVRDVDEPVLSTLAPAPDGMVWKVTQTGCTTSMTPAKVDWSAPADPR